jgi:type VI secretion system protein ImpA
MIDEAKIALLLKPISEAEPIGGLLDEDVANGSWDQQESMASASFDWERRLLDNAFGNETRQKYEEGVRWVALSDRCEATLKKESKDLRVAVRWTQSQFVNRGLEGLANGLTLVKRLLEQTQGACQPFVGNPTGVDESIVSVLKWLGRDLTKLARHATIGIDAAGTRVAWGEVEKQKAAAMSAIASGSLEALQTIHSSLVTSIEATDAVIKTLLSMREAWCTARGEEPDEGELSGTSDLSHELRKMLEFVMEHGSARLAPEEPEPAIEPEVVVASGAAPKAAAAPVVRPKMASIDPFDRSDALAAIERIAVFFERSEPTSPVPIMLRKSIKWASMGFADLMRELVADKKEAFSTIAWRVGISDEKEKSS